MRRSKVPAPPPACPLMECMKLLGGAWTPNIIWYLSECPRRFGELRADIPLVSAKVLAARLRALASKGVVNRVVVASSPPSVEYSLTDLGRELIPVIHAIINVGEKLKQDAAMHAQRSDNGAAARARTASRIRDRGRQRSAALRT